MKRIFFWLGIYLIVIALAVGILMGLSLKMAGTICLIIFTLTMVIELRRQGAADEL